MNVAFLFGFYLFTLPTDIYRTANGNIHLRSNIYPLSTG